MRITRKQLRNIILESLNVNQPTIYCDMDGVIADFDIGAINKMNEFLNFTSNGGVIESSSLRKSVNKVLSAYEAGFQIDLSMDIDADSNIKKLKYSSIIQDPGQFFYNLPPLIDGTTSLWPFINSLGLKVNILSAPIESSKGMPAAQGKELWVKDNLNPQPSEIIIVPAIQKQDYAKTNGMSNILIDDKEETIIQWNSAGGIGILHQTGNSQLTILELQKILSL